MGIQMLIAALIKAFGLNKIDPQAVEAVILQVIAEAPKLIANANMALAIANQRLAAIEQAQAEILTRLKQDEDEEQKGSLVSLTIPKPPVQ